MDLSVFKGNKKQDDLMGSLSGAGRYDRMACTATSTGIKWPFIFFLPVDRFLPFY
jgi:hypothetical protein